MFTCLKFFGHGPPLVKALPELDLVTGSTSCRRRVTSGRRRSVTSGSRRRVTSGRRRRVTSGRRRITSG